MKTKGSLKKKKPEKKKFMEIIPPSIKIMEAISIKEEEEEELIPLTPPSIRLEFSRGDSSPESRSNSPKYHGTPVSEKLQLPPSPLPSPANFISYLRNIDVMQINEDTENEDEEENTKDPQEKVYNFIQVPLEVEKFLFFGLILCLDSFLYFFTFLPIRIFYSIYKLIFRKFKVTKNQMIDFAKVIVIILNCFLMHYFLDYSQLYHWVRGESALKLYVFYNLLEVMEKLCCAFGEDIESAFYFTIVKKKPFDIFGMFLINSIYLC
jgi:hypothetical protein